MADTFDVTQQTNPGGNVNKPASGSYGDVANLDELKKALPQAPTTPSGPLSTQPMPTPQTGSIGTPPQGLPPGILAPTSRPDIPASTPMAAPPSAATPQSDRQRRLAIVDALLQAPNTSEVTREWAQHVKDALISGSTR